MPLPSVQARLADFQTDIDRLNDWTARMPSGSRWVERLNEMRLVRATLAWEDFLEQTLYCFLRGSTSVSGRNYRLAVTTATSLADAELLARGTDPYGRWLNELWVLGRTNALFSPTNPFALLASPTFREVRVIRNRIVHRSRIVRADFLAVALVLHGSARPGITPGRLLSELAGPQFRIETYLQSLRAAAQLIAA